MDDWREDRIGSAARGENPTVLRRLDAGFAVIGDVQFLPGYSLLLTDEPGVERLSDLPRAKRTAFLADLDRLGEAVENACRAQDSAFRRVNLEILGNTDPFLHAHIWPRYDWEPPELVVKPVWLYPPEHWRDPRFALGAQHDPLRAAITAELDAASDFWDAQAATFDDEPDHGLLDPEVRQAWGDLLLPLLPSAPASIIDLGCGTGSLSVLLAEAGHAVRGVDFSARMVEAAARKAAAAGVPAEFTQGDAAEPPYREASADVVLARHVLWALPDPAAALRKWVRLLKPGGLLVLIEGRWSTGAGLTADSCEALVLDNRTEAVVHRLDDPTLWGRTIDDERYLVVSRK